MKEKTKNTIHDRPLHDLEQEAMQFIRKHEPPEGYFVGFSGGKDSIVVYDLVKRAGVQHEVYHSCTGIDNKEIYQFLKKEYPEVIFLHPKVSFFRAIHKKGPPTRRMRWCCDALKKDPAKNIPLKQRIMGIRAEESYRRAERGRISEYKKITTLKPIFDWQEWAIWEYIDKYNLPYPVLYDQGAKRIGCQSCPMVTKTLQADTLFMKAYRKATQHWYENTRTEASKAKYPQPFDDYWHWYTSGKKRETQIEIPNNEHPAVNFS